MIRPTAQSFADVVSYIVEAWVPKCRCSGSDCCQIRQRMLNYLQRLYLVPSFNVVPDHGWLPHVQNPRRNQYNPLLARRDSPAILKHLLLCQADTQPLQACDIVTPGRSFVNAVRVFSTTGLKPDLYLILWIHPSGASMCPI